MRVIFRADSGIEQGTGHVMRCLTLAEELIRRGHEVHLITRPVQISWLREAISRAGVLTHSSQPHTIDLTQLAALRPDWLVVDSYEIPAVEVSAAKTISPVLAVIDGDDRGIDASLYLDQNLGAEDRASGLGDRFLGGSKYALVRQAIVESRRRDPWRSEGPDRVLCFMGGTDPLGRVIAVAHSVVQLRRKISLTVVAPETLHAAVASAVTGPTDLDLRPLSPELPVLIARSDVVVSAAGTSAWDICTLGVPAVFVAVVENQQASLRAAISQRLALGVDAVGEQADALTQVGPMVAKLLDDEALRRRLSEASLEAFDGLGSRRVASRLESHRP